MPTEVEKMFTDSERVLALLAMLGGKSEEILHHVKGKQTTIDYGTFDLTNTASKLDLSTSLRVPMIITAVIASANTNTANGIVTIGKDKMVWFSPPAPLLITGVEWHIEPHDAINLTLTTGVAQMGLIISGYADYRKVDRQ